MKNYGLPSIAILLILFPVLMHSCTEKDQTSLPLANINFDTLSFEHSMKGWELYSWPNADDWNYSILPGTNRLKSYEEVKNSPYKVTGKDSLKLLLDKIPEGELIFWIGPGWLERCWGGDFGDLSLPDGRTISEIREYCEQIDLELHVDN